MAQSTPTPQAIKGNLARQTMGAPYAAGSANVVHLFLLNTAHTKAQVEAAGYFNTVRTRLTKGAFIFAAMGQGGTLDRQIYQVTDPGSATADVVVKPMAAGSAGIVGGVAAVTGSATVATGLTTVVAVVAMLQEDASLANGISVTGTIGDQAGAPAAGSVTLSVWKPTASGDVTPVASAAAVHVNWIAFGTK